MKPDPVDHLGRRLFEAARQEPLPEGAIERAIAAVRREQVSSVRGSHGSRRTAAALWLAAAALFAGAVFFGRGGEPTAGISAEPRSLTERQRVPQPSSPPLQPRPQPLQPPPVAEDAPSAMVVKSAPRGLPRQAPSLRPVPVTLTDEISSLQIASSALGGGDARAALVALDQYDHMTGQKKMRAEATLLRVEALSRAGQPEAASALAKRFVEQNPESPLVDRARSFVQE